MSNASTIGLVNHYIENAPAPMFLASHFKSPASNYHRTKEVEFHIEREGEEVAVAVQSLASEGRKNQASLYQAKTFEPPIFKEDGLVNAFDLIKRMPGSTPYDDPNYQANAFLMASREIRLIQKKIQRSIELQASQVLQTGIVTLTDSTGAALYTLDYGTLSTHKVTVSNAWNGGSADPMADLEALAHVVRVDGKHMPSELIFGRLAWLDFLANAEVQAALNYRRAEFASLKRTQKPDGSVYMGQITIGSYDFALYVYDATYTTPAGAAGTRYVTDDFVIMLSDGAPLDLTYGAIPTIGRPDPRAADFIPSRFADSATGLDLHVGAWVAQDGQSLTVQVGARPLCVPTAIDTFGSLNTRP